MGVGIGVTIRVSIGVAVGDGVDAGVGIGVKVSVGVGVGVAVTETVLLHELPDTNKVSNSATTSALQRTFLILSSQCLYEPKLAGFYHNRY
jgi:hypothetical protein